MINVMEKNLLSYWGLKDNEWLGNNLRLDCQWKPC